MNKPEFKVGQVWKYDDGGKFTLKITQLSPLMAKCVNVGDSGWRIGQVGNIHYPDSLRKTASVIYEFNDYYKQIYGTI